MGLKEILEKQGGVNLLRQYWNGGAFFTAVGEFLLLGKSRTSLEILRNAASLKIKQKLEKEYSDKISEIEKKYKEETCHQERRKVWICWFQGMDSAPEIVKRCYASVRENITDREVVLLTEENYREYASFPQEIQNKIDCGIIKGAHMSDLLRLELLQKYGGTWIDATVFCSSRSIPAYMLDSDLFLFQCLKPGKDGQPSIISNWFMVFIGFPPPRYQPSCLLVGAVQGFHNFFKREDNIDSALLIQPVVFEGQTHTVQQDAIQNLCIRGQIFELGVCKQCLGYAVE